MGRKGACWDSAVAGSFFRTIKVEPVYGNHYHGRPGGYLPMSERIENCKDTDSRPSAIANRTIKESENPSQLKIKRNRWPAFLVKVQFMVWMNYVITFKGFRAGIRTKVTTLTTIHNIYQRCGRRAITL
jgi:transposase InsO family protein